MMLSIITISFNNLPGLERTYSSIRELLNSSDVEWIVVDGGSSDGTVEFLNGTKAHYKSEPDLGIYDAMNKGLRRAKGDYVWFLNAGDLCYSEWNGSALQDQLRQHHDVLYAETLLMDEGMHILGTRSQLTTRKLPEKLNKRSLLKGMVVGHQSFIVKKSICPEFDTFWKHVADYEWMIRVLNQTSDCQLLPKPLSSFDVTGHSNAHRNISNFERFKVMIKHFGPWETCVQHLRIIWVNLKRILFRKKAY